LGAAWGFLVFVVACEFALAAGVPGAVAGLFVVPAALAGTVPDPVDAAACEAAVPSADRGRLLA
jgi:hypothetical protein